jgi:hypothetical protein
MAAEKTPAANWREDGAKDPFGDQYNCERSELAMGYLTDDELANEVFLYDHRNGLASMPRLTAAKERIRWLSRKLVAAEEELARYKEHGLSPEDKIVVARARKVQKFLSQPFAVAEAFTGRAVFYNDDTTKYPIPPLQSPTIESTQFAKTKAS